MKSPFPGMDPFLERHWEDVHHRLIQYACDTLQPRLPNELWARVEERVFVQSDSGRQRHIVPDASLVEIDLARAGQRALALPDYEIPIERRGDYLACISPGWKRNRRELYPMPLRQRLPVLPIPLRPEEPPVTLDLQALVDQAYTTGRYDRLDYETELDPPLPTEDAAWAEALLKAAGKR